MPMLNVNTILFKYRILWSSINWIFLGDVLMTVNFVGKETALQFTVAQGKRSEPC